MDLDKILTKQDAIVKTQVSDKLLTALVAILLGRRALREVFEILGQQKHDQAKEATYGARQSAYHAFHTEPSTPLTPQKPKLSG